MHRKIITRGDAESLGHELADLVREVLAGKGVFEQAGRINYLAAIEIAPEHEQLVREVLAQDLAKGSR